MALEIAPHEKCVCGHAAFVHREGLCVALTGNPSKRCPCRDLHVTRHTRGCQCNQWECRYAREMRP